MIAHIFATDWFPKANFKKDETRYFSGHSRPH